MTKKSIKFSESEFYFGNCPICQAMEKAEGKGRALTKEELKKAFEKAREQGAVVVGKWFEKEEK